MTSTSAQTRTTKTQSLTRWQRVGPIITLLVLSPVISELLFGAIRITTFFALIPATGAWGCGALLIRDVVRRRKLRWTSILLLGAALSIAEECLIQQTSLAPLVGVDPSQVYGRALGVNWVYFLWAVGYESVWAVVIPIIIAEQLFPKRREAPWLRRRGMMISAIVFLGASVMAWYFWTQVYVPHFFPASAYSVPVAHTVVAWAAVGSLVAVALVRRPCWIVKQAPLRSVQRPWLLGIAGLAIGLLWFVLVFLAYRVSPGLPPAIPLVIGVLIGSATHAGIKWWSGRFGWDDVNVLALILGTLTASMLAGFLVLYGSSAPLIDYVGKAVLDVLAISAMARLLVRLSKSSASPDPSDGADAAPSRNAD